MKKTLWMRLRVISVLVFTVTLVHVVNVFFDGQLNQFGIVPRRLESWFHILTAPFIHGGAGHLIGNLLGLCIFSALCMLRSVRFFFYSSAFIIVLGGGLVWLFGRPLLHIGASGWIFGLWSLLISMAWFERRFMNILIGLFVLFFYGGMIYELLPTDPGVSYEAHIFGVISGVLCAFLCKLKSTKPGFINKNESL